MADIVMILLLELVKLILPISFFLQFEMMRDIF